MTSRPASTNVPAARSGPRGNRRRAAAAIVALLAVLSGAVVSTAAAQEDNTAGDSTTVRIVARKLESGRIEFGLQQRQPDNTWGARQLPRVRFFPTTATVGSWLASSSLDLPAGEVRIVARKLESGRIEFGLQQRQPDNTWGDRQLPRVRFFPTTATAGNWLASSTLTLTTPQPAPQPGGESTGRYTAVTAGYSHSCGLRTDGTITCWGDNGDGRATAPAGQYSAVTAGSVHSCGLRTDGTITCWGLNNFGEATAPAGQYSAVTAGGLHSCGLRTNGTITCWGYNGDGRAPAPDGQTPAPDGQYSAVTAGVLHSCGLRTNGTITCWGNNTYGQATAPDGQYSAVTAGAFHTCGLRTNGTITCWDTNGNGRATAPDGQYSAVTAGGFHTCGLRTNGTITCWGNNGDGAGDRARWAVLRRHRRHLPFVWAAHQRHHHLLGQQRQRAGDRARWAVLRRHRRRGVFVRAAHQRHHHLLGQSAFPHGIAVGPRRQRCRRANSSDPVVTAPQALAARYGPPGGDPAPPPWRSRCPGSRRLQAAQRTIVAPSSGRLRRLDDGSGGSRRRCWCATGRPAGWRSPRR